MESNKRRQNGKEKKRIDLRSRKTLIIIGSVVVLGIIFLVSVGAVFANKKDDKNDILRTYHGYRWNHSCGKQQRFHVMDNSARNSGARRDNRNTLQPGAAKVQDNTGSD